MARAFDALECFDDAPIHRSRFGGRVEKAAERIQVVAVHARATLRRGVHQVSVTVIDDVDEVEVGSRAADAVTRLLLEAFVPAARGYFPLKTLKNAQSKDVGVVRASQILGLALS